MELDRRRADLNRRLSKFRAQLRIRPDTALQADVDNWAAELSLVNAEILARQTSSRL